MSHSYYQPRPQHVDGLTLLATILYGIALAVCIDRWPDRRGLNPHRLPHSGYPQHCAACGLHDVRTGTRVQHRCGAG